MKFKRIVKGDLLLLVAIVIIAAGVTFYNRVMVPARGSATKVLIEIEGQVQRELDITRDITQLKFETEYGFNVIEIKNGKVRVVGANCPDLLCVHTGWRQHVGQLIVCLPHHFVVRIVGDGKDLPELDGFTY